MAARKKDDDGTRRVKVGQVSMTVRPWRHPSGRDYWRAAYTDGEGRVRHITRASREDAIHAATTKAREIHNGIVDLSELPPDQLRLVRAFLNLSPTWDDLERISALRGDRGLTVSDAITRYMAWKRSEKTKETRHLDLTEADLLRMAEAVGPDKPLAAIRASALAKWLDGMPVGPKRKKSYRAACVALWRWARRQDLLPVLGELTEPEKLPVPRVPKKDAVRILSVEELRFLLEKVSPEFLPWLVLSAFSGLRSGEIRHPKKLPLDWSMVHRDRRLIDLPPSLSKTGRRKLLPISDTLAAWLDAIDPPAKGEVIPEQASDHETGRLGALMDAHFQRAEGWPTNCLRHSFGSHRVAETGDIAAVALEMDNSPDIIRRHYLEARTKDQAAAYFGVLPRTFEEHNRNSLKIKD